jgi:hypothetical protein
MGEQLTLYVAYGKILIEAQLGWVWMEMLSISKVQQFGNIPGLL